jgi:hypothetical protein
MLFEHALSSVALLNGLAAPPARCLFSKSSFRGIAAQGESEQKAAIIFCKNLFVGAMSQKQAHTQLFVLCCWGVAGQKKFEMSKRDVFLNYNHEIRCGNIHNLFFIQQYFTAQYLFTESCCTEKK